MVDAGIVNKILIVLVWRLECTMSGGICRGRRRSPAAERRAVCLPGCQGITNEPKTNQTKCEIIDERTGGKSTTKPFKKKKMKNILRFKCN